MAEMANETETTNEARSSGSALNDGLERLAFEKWINGDSGNERATERAGDGYKLMQTHLYWLSWIERAKYSAVLVHEIKKLENIKKAAENLVKVKGRHNSEIAMNRLIDALRSNATN